MQDLTTEAIPQTGESMGDSVFTANGPEVNSPDPNHPTNLLTACMGKYLFSVKPIHYLKLSHNSRTRQHMINDVVAFLHVHKDEWLGKWLKWDLEHKKLRLINAISHIALEVRITSANWPSLSPLLIIFKYDFGIGHLVHNSLPEVVYNFHI